MAVNLNCFSNGFPDDIDLAIVIAGSQITDSIDQRHAGFVARGGNDDLLLFDLAWHDALRQTPISHEYAYLIADFLDPVNASAIIAFLVTLHHANKEKFTYSINYEDGEYFDKNTGQKLKTKPGQGLTCATFVLEVLSRYGFMLIDKKTWPLTTENEKWQQDILSKLMTSRPASVDEFLPQVDLVGKVPRVKPEEALGAASLYDEDPLDYTTVLPAAVDIVSELDRIGLR